MRLSGGHILREIAFQTCHLRKDQDTMIEMPFASLLFIRIRCLLFACLSLFYISPASIAQTNEFRVFDSQLSKGLDMGVDSSEQRRDWVSKGQGYIKMSYPSGQDWGAVFVTVGKPRDLPRPSKDLSAFRMLVIELKGESGGEQVEIGIKTNKQPDDGSEVKIPVRLTNTWQVFKFPLSKFDVDLKNLYVLSEFVFTGGTAQTVYFRGISYEANDGGSTKSADKRDANDNAAGATVNSNPPGSVPSVAEVSFAAITPTISFIASLIFAAVILAILIWVLLKGSEPLTEHQQAILRLFMALSAGLLSVFFVGGVLLDGTLKGFALSATGGFVIFILIFFSSSFQAKPTRTRTRAK